MKIYKTVQNIILIAAVAIIAGMGTFIYVLNIHPHIVVSGSMEPEIHTGSLCFIDYRDKDAKPGDIIAFKSGSVTVTHRVIRKTEDGYITKGDNNDSEDLKPVKREDILGKNIFWIRGIGYAAMSVKTLKGVLIIGILFICLILEGILLNKHDTENKIYKEN